MVAEEEVQVRGVIVGEAVEEDVGTIETETLIAGLLEEIWIAVVHVIQDPQDAVLIREIVPSDLLLEKPIHMYLVGVEDQDATHEMSEAQLPDHPLLLAQYQTRARAPHLDAVIVPPQDLGPPLEDTDPELVLDHQIDEVHIEDEEEEGEAEAQTVGIAVGDHQLCLTALVHALLDLQNDEELLRIQPVDHHHQEEHVEEVLAQYQAPDQNPGRDLRLEQDRPLFPDLSVIAQFARQPTVET